ncbi:olfactory receptor 10A3-like [Chaetodon auriga]|uniref:olfactory receptor 10A3-like n=1 Tax=Chaetodon auriga TaxID=39042 RepID=UPI0040329332
MINSTLSSLSYFILDAYVHVGSLKYVYFMITAVLYTVMITANLLLIVVICVNRSLHEPMYLFLCSLFVNELYGSSGLFPFLLLQILSDIHTVSASLCFLQIFCLYTYVNAEFCNLAVMSYDRYLAICCPLQYNTRMTSHRVLVFVAVVWLYSCVKCLITLSLNIGLPRCGNVLNSLYCHNYQIVKLSCSDIEARNIYGLFATALSILVPLLPILFSYMKILKVCFSGSTQTKQKAVSTCTPHLASVINFSFGCFFEIVQTRLDMNDVPTMLRIMLSLYFSVLQPLLNPIMYGLQMSKIRQTCRDVFCYKMLTVHRDSYDQSSQPLRPSTTSPLSLCVPVRPVLSASASQYDQSSQPLRPNTTSPLSLCVPVRPVLSASASQYDQSSQPLRPNTTSPLSLCVPVPPVLSASVSQYDQWRTDSDHFSI